MRIIFMFLLIGQAFGFQFAPEPESELTIKMGAAGEIIWRKEPQTLLSFVMADLELFKKGTEIYLRDTAWRTTPDFSDYFALRLDSRLAKMSDIEEYLYEIKSLENCFNLFRCDAITKIREDKILNPKTNEEAMHIADVRRSVEEFPQDLYVVNLAILQDIMAKIDIKPVFDILDQIEYKGINNFALKLRMLYEESYGDRKTYLDCLYELTSMDGAIRPTRGNSTWFDRYAEAAAEDNRFYEALKKTFANSNKQSELVYLELADFLKQNKGRSAHSVLLSAMESENLQMVIWAFRQIQEKKIKELYDDVLRVFNERVVTDRDFCSPVASYIPFEREPLSIYEACSFLPMAERTIKPGSKLREGF